MLEDTIQRGDEEKVNKEEIITRERARLVGIRDAINEARNVNIDYSLEDDTRISILEQQFLKIWSLIEESKKEKCKENNKILDSVKFTQEDQSLIIDYYSCYAKEFDKDSSTEEELERQKDIIAHIEIFDYLIDKGINIHTIKNEMNILYIAANNSDLQTVRYLLTKQGADINSLSTRDFYFIKINLIKECDDIIELLFKCGIKLPGANYLKTMPNLVNLANPLMKDEEFNKIKTENKVELNGDNSRKIFLVQFLQLVYLNTFNEVSYLIKLIEVVNSIEDVIRESMEEAYPGSLYDLLKDPAKLAELRQTDEELFIKTLNYYSHNYPPLQNCISKILNAEQLSPEEENGFMRTIKQVVKPGKYLETVSQAKINELIIQIPELASAVKSFLAMVASNEEESGTQLSDYLANKLKLALDYYNEVRDLEAGILNEIEGIMVEPLHEILAVYSEEEYAQFTQGSMFCKTIEYYHNNYPALRECLAKILTGSLLTAEEKAGLISAAQIVIHLGDYIKKIMPKTLALHMKQNNDIYKLTEKLSMLTLPRELEGQLNKAIKIYNIINDIDNEQDLAEVLGIELSGIPPVKIIEDNTANEGELINEWLKEQFSQNNESLEQDGSRVLNEEEAELEAQAKGIPDFSPRG